MGGEERSDGVGIFQGRSHDVKKEEAVQEVWGTESPSGVQGRSPGGSMGG